MSCKYMHQKNCIDANNYVGSFILVKSNLKFAFPFQWKNKLYKNGWVEINV